MELVFAVTDMKIGCPTRSEITEIGTITRYDLTLQECVIQANLLTPQAGGRFPSGSVEIRLTGDIQRLFPRALTFSELYKKRVTLTIGEPEYANV